MHRSDGIYHMYKLVYFVSSYVSLIIDYHAAVNYTCIWHVMEKLNQGILLKSVAN